MTRHSQASDHTALERLNEQWAACATNGDVEGVVALYTTDGTLVWPDAEAVHGTDAIRIAWTGMLAAPGVWIRFVPTTVTFSESEDLAVDFGVVELRMPPTAPMQTAKYLVVWKRVDGDWKVLYDAWNPNAPTAPAAVS